MKRWIKILYCTVLMCAPFFSRTAGAQSVVELRRDVEYLCADSLGGRATGTHGGNQAALYVADRFRSQGLLPLGDSYIRTFETSEGNKTAHNVIGMRPSNTARSLMNRTRKYVIVMSKFDGIGTLSGVTYPGADSNASGVAAMLALSEITWKTAQDGRFYPFDILFVALDGSQMSNAGSKALYDDLSSGRLTDPVTGKVIRTSQVKMVVNLDILGTSLAPLKSGRRDFLIMLSSDEFEHSKLKVVNKNYSINMELAFDYYGSRGFTNLFYNKISSQSVFVQHGINSVMFTSGITMNTNKVEDNPESLDYELLSKRVELIYRWLAARAY